MKHILSLVAALCLPAGSSVASDPTQVPCHDQVPCAVGDRSYHVKLPDDWDGTSPMPVMMHFHGWQRTGALPVRHQRISGATRRRGVLLVAPNGLRKTWNFWSADTPDVDFASAVLADVVTRFPVDPDRIYVSGYSFGSAMAWRFACERGQGIAGLIAVAGTLSQEETCPQTPVEVRHVHGLDDSVMDFPMGPGGDTSYPVKLWRDAYGCDTGTARGPWAAVDFLTFERTTWDCGAGRGQS